MPKDKSDEKRDMEKAQERLKLQLQEQTANLDAANKKLQIEIEKSRQLEAALRFQSEIASHITEAVNLVRLSDNTVVYSNPAFEKMFGYTPDEIVGKPISAVIAATDKTPDETVKELTDDLEKYWAWHGEVKHVRKDGTEFWCFGAMSVFEHYEFGRVALILHRDETARKMAQEELRQSEEKFSAAFHASPDLFAITRLSDGMILELNKGYETLLGYTREESIGKTTRELSIWADLADRDRFVSGLEKFGEVKDLEIRLRRKDGSIVDVLDSGRKLDLHGQTCILSVAHDITDRKAAERKLAENSAFLANIDRVNKIISSITDTQEMMRAFLDEVLAIFNCDRALFVYPCNPDALAWRVSMVRQCEGYPNPLEIDKEMPLLPESANVFRMALESKRAITFNKVSQNLSAAARSFFVKSQIAMAVYPKWREPFLFIINQLFYDRVWTEDEINLFNEIGLRITDSMSNLFLLEDLTAEKEKAQKYLDVAGVMLLVLNADQTVSLINKKGCEILGYSESDIIGKNWHDNFLPEKTRDQVKETFNELISGKGKLVEDYENPVMTKDKEERIIYWHNTVMRNEEKQITHILSSGEDITERKIAQETIRELNLELEQKVSERTKELEIANKDLASFAYVASHDLKAPLRGINQLSAWLLEDYSPKLDEKGKELLNLLISRTVMMNNLIEGILQYSRAGRVTASKEPTDLNVLVREVVDAIAPPENIKIKIEKLPTLWVDKIRIQQVFQNLLSNAVKFMDKVEGRITVRCVEKDKEWQFCVSDNGPGIEEKDYEKIFEIFQTLVTKRGSTGIGLSIVKRIVEFCGGRVWVESKPGMGSDFYFTLPKEGEDK